MENFNAFQLVVWYFLMEEFTEGQKKVANRLAREHGYGRATQIVLGKRTTIVRANNWHYTTPSGDIVRYPSAYKKKGFNIIYHAAQCVVELDAKEWPPYR